MKRIRLSIDGMTCGHCVQSVQSAILAIPGVESCDVLLEANCADVTLDESVELGPIAHAIGDAGFRLSGFAPLPADGTPEGEAS